MSLTVSRLAAQAGISSDTVRYYDRIGVLRPAPRTASGYRIYEVDAVERLHFVKSAQRLGLKLDEIRELLEIRDEGACPCGHADALIDRRIGELDEEIGRLTALRGELQQMVSARVAGDRCIDTLLHEDRVDPDRS
ncbi:N/A [soil metagenome]